MAGLPLEGPQIELNFKAGEEPVSLKAKYLQVFDVVNRLEDEAASSTWPSRFGCRGPEPEDIHVTET